MFDDPSTRRRFLRDAGLAGAAAAAIPAWVSEVAEATDYSPGAICPHPNPIVQENRCTNPFTFTGNFQLSNPTSIMAGFARQTSVDVGQPVELVISGPNNYLPPSPSAPLETVQVELYRLGYYDGYGGRKVWTSASGISTFQKVNGSGTPDNAGNRRPARPNDVSTGLTGNADDRTIVTIPGSALTTSGVYLAKCLGNWYEYPPSASPVPRSGESHIVFIVRDDGRPRDVLVVLPTNTWQAYNAFTGRSLYTSSSKAQNNGSIVPATGTERAAKVSFDRPYGNYIADYSWVLRSEFPAIFWLERHGYDVAYTEDVALSYAPTQMMPGTSKGVMILGHSEYWSAFMRNGVTAARNAGTSIFSLSANTCYWKVRYETADGASALTADEARVLVCYKTVEGGGSTVTNPDTKTGLTGADTVSSQADPVSPTTTWRDPGKSPSMARPGTWSATPATYTGPNQPEAALLGAQFIGYDDAENRGLDVPADNGLGEFAGHRAWRYCGLPRTGTTIGQHIVGWEWDGVPDPGMPFTALPTVKSGTTLQRLSATDPRDGAPATAGTQYLQDAGRRYSALGATAAPPPGASGVAHATTYTAPSGALVFQSGTILWSWGLGPHYAHRPKDTYADPPVDTSDQRIIQATTNLLADGGILPLTPEGLLFDAPDVPVPTPTPGPTPTPTPAATPTPTPLPGEPPAPTPTPAPATDPPAATPGPQPSPTPPVQPALIPTLALRLSSGKVGRSGKLTARVRAASPVPRAVTGEITLTLGRTKIASARYTLPARASRTARVSLQLTSKARRELRDAGRARPLARITIVENGRPVRTDFTRLEIRQGR